MKTFNWNYRRPAYFNVPSWELSDDTGVVHAWVDATVGGWTIYSDDPTSPGVVYATAEEAKAVCFMLLKLEGDLDE